MNNNNCVSGDIRISEVLCHTDDPYYDFIELWNDGSKVKDISGWYLSDQGSVRTKIRIPNGTILQPNQYMSFNLIKMTGDRLSKMNEHVYVGKLNETGGYELEDDQKVESSINHISYSTYTTTDGDRDFVLSFTTEEMSQQRYPIIHPFVISEVKLWDDTPGGTAYVRIQCIRGKDGYNINGPATMTTRGSDNNQRGYELRFDQQKKVFDDGPNGALIKTPPAFYIPITVTLTVGDSIYIVEKDPAAFAAARGLPANRVFGPWSGKINRDGDRIALYGYEGHPAPTYPVDHTYFVEKVSWKPHAPWPVPEPNATNFTIRKISFNSYGNEPRNWKIKGTNIVCDPVVGGGSCPFIDNCTIANCPAATGICQYTALACNHPRFSSCYPSKVCDSPAKYGYSTCAISATDAFFGHGIADPGIFGVYLPAGSSTYLEYWEAGCTVIPIDCHQTQWSSWTPCSTCGQTSTRSRSTLIAAKDGGIACGPLVDNTICNQSILCDCVVSQWTQWSECSKQCPTDNFASYDPNSTGIQNRTRAIIVPRRGSGKPCPTFFYEEQECGQDIVCVLPTPTPTELSTSSSNESAINSLAENAGGIPAWAWIVIAIGIVIVIGVIVAVVVLLKKKAEAEDTYQQL